MEKHMAVCPYCGAGCKLNLIVDDGMVIGAEGLDGVPGLADAGRVRQAQQHAADAHRLLDGVARRPGDVRDDDAVIARQPVQQR